MPDPALPLTEAARHFASGDRAAGKAICARLEAEHADHPGVPHSRALEVQSFGRTEEALAGLSRHAEALDAIDRAVAPYSDLATTHAAPVAAAMGVPVWVPLCYAPDWRWLLDRDDTPWYPTMRLFRQDRPGDRGGPIGRIADAPRAGAA